MAKKIRSPLPLGPEDLAETGDARSVNDLDYERIGKLITRHLDAHLPVLVDQAVEDAVEPIARRLSKELRKAVLDRLNNEKKLLVEDIIDDLKTEL